MKQLPQPKALLAGSALPPQLRVSSSRSCCRALLTPGSSESLHTSLGRPHLSCDVSHNSPSGFALPYSWLWCSRRSSWASLLLKSSFEKAAQKCLVYVSSFFSKFCVFSSASCFNAASGIGN